ncbi:leucine zipper protein 1 [Poecilia latipinna]|uniref:Leucine zipper protein 1 n=1 Tax=Poecilia latipinna TaxID=48699 RepID=A0A3B3VZN1_9TELE|nr:PREDICTED: leucine zipper protein 1 [Poecilia latipinna]XP_014873493.1 PREDICTED: leucine zipper protein 1 [Poecilia latipinna]XP_014873494.1 PREDICTED: leucine zipper protein 1 [Poecilia latipinna]XP_014873495.1 PREDICTED: leucine zipper protein 1 [Poecilia latipinna]
MSDHKDMTHRHLRHKLQSLGRRLDELEEATNKLQKSEDELLDLQDKIIQAEGSNSSLLGDVEALRKRLLKIQGKDEEVRKAEDLCRTVREKLEEEENLTKELKGEIERLQRRMAELEKLEEAFAKSKSDCSQLCLSLNEEKNLTKKLSSELETLRARLKEVEGSETKLDKAEQALAKELEKLKAFTQAFVSERKKLLEKQREDEKIIQKLSEERKSPDRSDFMSSRIEDELSSTALFTSKLSGKKNLDYLKLADEKLGIINKSEIKKGSQEEDNKVKELTQEVEKLKNRLKQMEAVEEDLKNTQFQNGELHEKFQMEQRRSRQLNEQVEQLRMQLCGKAGIGGKGIGHVEKHGNGNPAKVLENGKAENEEAVSTRQEKPKFKSSAAFTEPGSPKHRVRELSPQHRRETMLRGKGESSPKMTKRPLSPALRNRRTPKTTSATVSSDNGVTSRFPEERPKGASHTSEVKKASVLSRYPPAANEPKPQRSPFKQTDAEAKNRERFSKAYGGSDTESNNSDAVPENVGVNNVSAAEKEAVSASDQEPTDTVQESLASKANGSYTAYKSHITPLLPNDLGSDSHSSASETESTGSRPSEVEPVAETISASVSSRTTSSKYTRYPHVHDSQSEGSSSRSSFDEDLFSRVQPADGGGRHTPVQTPSSIEIQRVCSPREALRSKAVIKPAIVEIDRKEVMISESLSTNGKPKISTKPIVSSSSKMTSSITIYPSDPSSSRTSSRSSSLSSEPMPVKERHTSTSNFVIGPSSDHRGSISVPYEISIPKSEIALRPCQDQDCGDDVPTKTKLHSASRLEASSSHASHQRGGRRRSSDFNDTESGFESGSSTAMVTSWRSQTQTELSADDASSDTKNVTVRSTWKNKASKALMDVGSEDEAETATTWRAYRATTFDSEEAVNNAAPQKGTKPAEAYMRRYNSATSAKEAEELMLRRDRRSESPVTEAGILGRTIPHAPVTSQSWSRSYSQAPLAKDAPDPALNPCSSPASWRRHPQPGASYDRLTKAGGAATRGGEPWSSRGPAPATRTEGRTGAGSRTWSHCQSEHR